jgi:hypothetical protein
MSGIALRAVSAAFAGLLGGGSKGQSVAALLPTIGAGTDF